MSHFAAVLSLCWLKCPACLVAAMVQATSLVLGGQVADLWVLVGSCQRILICLEVGVVLRVHLVLDEMVRFSCGLGLILAVLDQGLLRLLEGI